MGARKQEEKLGEIVLVVSEGKFRDGGVEKEKRRQDSRRSSGTRISRGCQQSPWSR